MVIDYHSNALHLIGDPLVEKILIPYRAVFHTRPSCNQNCRQLIWALSPPDGAHLFARDNNRAHRADFASGGFRTSPYQLF